MASEQSRAADDGNKSPLNEVTLDDLIATRLAVYSLSIRGAKRTRQEFLEKLISPIVSTGGTFGGVIEDVHDAVERIRATGVFSGADAFLESGPNKTTNVVMSVTEKAPYQIRTGTFMRSSGERDASVEASVVWRNVLGRADTLSGSTAYWGGFTQPNASEKIAHAHGTVPSNSLALHYTAPFVHGLRNSAFARVEQLSRLHGESNFRERTREAICGIHTPLGNFSGRTAWREVSDVDEKASVLVREQAGHSWKGSLHHEIGVDLRDDSRMPTSGYSALLQTEMAGLFGGDARFRKVEAEAQLHVPVGSSGLSVALSGRVGGIVAPDSGTVSILDRFFVGGPNSLRGFDHRGIGPRESGSALGSSAFYSIGMFISAPTPESSLLHQLFRARIHGFAVAGDMGELSHVRHTARKLQSGLSTSGEAWKILRDSARTAVGVGIAADTAFGRVEVNLTRPICIAPSDKPNFGVQIGLSKEFM